MGVAVALFEHFEIDAKAFVAYGVLLGCDGHSSIDEDVLPYVKVEVNILGGGVCQTPIWGRIMLHVRPWRLHTI